MSQSAWDRALQNTKPESRANAIAFRRQSGAIICVPCSDSEDLPIVRRSTTAGIIKARSRRCAHCGDPITWAAKERA